MNWRDKFYQADSVTFLLSDINVTETTKDVTFTEEGGQSADCWPDLNDKRHDVRHT